MATNLPQREICLCASKGGGNTQKKGRLTIQCDRLWSFVDNKGNKPWWVWLALNAVTREIVGVYIGATDRAAATGLWNSLPSIYPQCAIAYTDFWVAYGAVLPCGFSPVRMPNHSNNSLISRFAHES